MLSNRAEDKKKEMTLMKSIQKHLLTKLLNVQTLILQMHKKHIRKQHKHNLNNYRLI